MRISGGRHNRLDASRSSAWRTRTTIIGRHHVPMNENDNTREHRDSPASSTQNIDAKPETLAVHDGACGRCGAPITAGSDQTEPYTQRLPKRGHSRRNNGQRWAHVLCPTRDHPGVLNSATDPVSLRPWPHYPHGGTMIDWVNRRCRDLGVPTPDVVKLLPARLPVDVQSFHETVDNAIRTVLSRPKGKRKVDTNAQTDFPLSR